MRTTSRAAVGALALGLVLGLSGCGQAMEKAAEEAAGQAIGGDVDISDGNVSVKDDQGNELSVGDNVQLPSSWPSDVPALDGGTLTMAGADPNGGFSAMWSVSGTPEEAGGAYAAQLEAAGFTKDPDSMLDTADMSSYIGNGLRIMVTASPTDAETGVLVIITPEEGAGASPSSS